MSADRKSGESEADAPDVGFLRGLYYDSSFYLKVGVSGLVILIVVLALGGFTVMNASSAMNQQADQSIKQSVTAESTSVDYWMQTNKQFAAGIADTRAVTNASLHGESGEHGHGHGEDPHEVSQVEQHLNDRLTSAGNSVSAIHYVNAENNYTVLASTETNMSGTNASELNRGWVGVEANEYNGIRSVVTTEPYTTEATPTMAFVTPVNDSPHHLIVVEVNLREASTILRAPNSGRAFMFNEQGTVILSTTPTLIGTNAYDQGIATEDEFSLAGQSPTASFTQAYVSDDITVDGTEYVTGVVLVEEEEWVVASQQPNSVAFSTLQSVQQYMIYLVGGSLLAIILVMSALGLTTVRSLNRLRSRATSVSEGDFDTPLATYRDDEIGAVYQSVDSMRDTLRDRIDEVEQINSQLQANVEEFNTVLDRAADGDLTTRMDEDTGVEQLDQLAANFNGMLADLEEVVSEAKTFGGSVSAASEQATQNIKSVEESSQMVAEAAQEINDGAVRQNDMLDETVDEMNSLSSTIEEVAASANQVAEQATQTAELSHEGREAAADASESLDEIEERAESVTQSIESLNEEVEEIGEVTDYIQQVAEQTNMLAINAGIEASRAGEAGEGFGVVADEVKQLADDANDAADDIEELLLDLQDKAEQTQEDIEAMQDSLDTGSETIADALDALDEIANSVDETVDGIKEIDNATERQADSAQEVVTRVDDVSSISEETVEQSEDVAAATEEQSANVEEISDSIGHLTEQATELSDLLDEFEVAEESDDEADE